MRGHQEARLQVTNFTKLLQLCTVLSRGEGAPAAGGGGRGGGVLSTLATGRHKSSLRRCVDELALPPDGVEGCYRRIVRLTSASARNQMGILVNMAQGVGVVVVVVVGRHRRS